MHTVTGGRSRAATTSKMKHFVIIVNGFQPFTIITKCYILDVAAALDPPQLFSSSTKLLSLTIPNTILQKDLIWKSKYKFFCHKINVYFQDLNEHKKGYLICSTRTLNLPRQVRDCMPIYKAYVLHILIYLHMNIKK